MAYNSFYDTIFDKVGKSYDDMLIKERPVETIKEKTEEEKVDVTTTEDVVDKEVIEEIKVEESEDDKFFRTLSEKTSGKYTKLEDLQPKELEFKNDESAKLYKLFMDGEVDKVKEVLDKKYYDASKLDKDTVAFTFLKESNPDWTDNEVQDYLIEEFARGKQPLTDEDRDSMSTEQIAQYEKELKNGARDFKKLVADGINYLNSKNRVDTIELPELDFNPKEVIPDGYMKESDFIDKYSKQQEESSVETQKYWQGVVDGGLKGFDKTQKIKVDLGESNGGDFEFTYEISDNEFKDLKDFLSDYGNTTNYDQKFVTKDGDNIKVDVQSMVQEKMWSMLGPKILKSAIKEAVNIGKDSLLKTVKNSDWSSKRAFQESGNKENFYQMQYNK